MINKTEALRDKVLAEKLMRKSDFSTAREFAIKAQKMDETLKNIVQMIMVCDVHCAASDDSRDNTDWYKILQIEHNADDNTIKKQYKKFALHLHPDKNKLPGAEVAFKTIGEAYSFLLDKEKRRLHDMKRKSSKSPAPVPSNQPQQTRQQAPATDFYTPPFQSNINVARNSFSAGLRPENQQKPQAQPAGVSENKKVPTQEAGKTVHKQPDNPARISRSKEGPRAKRPGTSVNINEKKKRKKTVESSDSSSSESSYELEEVATVGQHSRRSVRSKQNVSQDVHVLRKAAKSNQVRHCSPPSSEPDCTIIPNFEFHDFSAERMKGTFRAGQIWSLNCKEEGLPKYYAKIQKVESRPMFKLKINRLELESLPENVTQWRDRRMPVSCGTFTLKGRCEALTHVTGFSHLIKAQESKWKNEYTILPKIGEIWAMYKNWSDAIEAASLKKCDYKVVEVLDYGESCIEVMMLERVDGFISVFKVKEKGGTCVRRTIPRCELLRFSHLVPAFRLTGERDGALRCCVELDASALTRSLRGT